MSFNDSRWQILLSRVLEAINRRLNRFDIRSICLLILAAYSVIAAISFATQISNRTIFGPQLGTDFAAFYIAGEIYSSVSPDRIYDRDLQRKFYHQHFPSALRGEELPYVNSPFFVLPFLLLARLGYSWAYLVWTLFSLSLFVSGFTLLWRTLDGLPQDAYLNALLIGLSFMPFLVECLAGGQSSAFGFFSLALAINCERRNHRVMSGAVLSLCLYKPTLLLLIAPMLIVTRRFAALSGLAIGVALLALLSWLLVGTAGSASYIRMLLFFADSSVDTAGSVFKSWKYVDLNSFSRLLSDDKVYLRWSLISGALLVFLPVLSRCWWKADREDKSQQSLVWAFTITWTMVLNIYVGIYDTTLVVIGALLMADIVCRKTSGREYELPIRHKIVLLMLYLIPWITQPVAMLTGIQLFTLALGLFGSYQLYQFKTINQSSKLLPFTYDGEYSTSVVGGAVRNDPTNE
jgi:hypothetical protein